MNKRLSNVDTVRGLACLLLVLYHVIGNTPNAGLKVAEGEWLRYLNDYLALIRMPLFTFISGYIYCLRPFSTQAIPFIKGKARRLLVPMLIVGSIFAFSQALIPGTNQGLSGNDWLLLHIMPVAHYWYLPALFLIFLIILPLEHFRLLQQPFSCLGLILLASAIDSYWLNPPKIFGFSGCLYLLPYFLAGVTFYRFKPQSSRGQQQLNGLLFILGALMTGYFILQADEQPNLHGWPAIILGITLCCLALSLFPSFKPLSQLGKYSYSIYLFHVFGTAGARIVLQRFGIDNLYLLLSCGLLAGIFSSIILEHIISRHRFSRFAFNGKSLPLRT